MSAVRDQHFVVSGKAEPKTKNLGPDGLLAELKVDSALWSRPDEVRRELHLPSLTSEERRAKAEAIWRSRQFK